MLVFLSIAVIVLGLVSFKPKVVFDGHIDAFENDGYVALRIFGIRIMRAALKFESEDLTHNNLIVKTGKHETEIHLNIDKKDKQSIIRILNYPAFENILIHKLDLAVRVGKSNDAFFTTIVLGGIRMAICSVLAYIKSRWGCEIRENFTPEYNIDRFEADFYGIISISFADIIYSYLLSKIHKKQKLKEVRANDSRKKRAPDRTHNG